jgi:hypothetical protein
MGTKGQKNTPITARVNAGLFNQKKGVTEPLLGVGPAGVYGDNQTRDIPSPSKLKGYPQRSPLKQKLSKEKPIQAVLGSESAGSQIVKKGKEKTKRTYKKPTRTPEGDAAYAALTPEQRKAQDDRYRKRKKNQIDTPTGEFEPDEIINVPGENTIKLEDLEKKGKRGINESWEAGSQARRMKRLSDDISDSEKKSGKYTSRLAKHTDPKTGKAKKGHERRFRNATANLAESQRNMTGSQGQYDTYAKGVSRGASGYHNDTFTVKEQATIGSVSDDINKQVEFLKGNTGKTNTNDPDVKKNPLTTKTKTETNTTKKRPKVEAVSVIEPVGIKSSGLGDNEPPTAILKTSSRLFAKKSPMKKGYFKK